MSRTTAAGAVAHLRAASKFLPAIALAFAWHSISFAAEPETGGDIVVVSTQGEVSGAKRGKLALPARVRTGAASAVEIRQGRTTISVAADTELEIAAPAVQGQPIERVVQSKGNAFYSVGKRDRKKFRVETPYLVAVVKGTQFNIVVQDERASISLFEGQLEIATSEGTGMIDLRAGQIAERANSEAQIRTLRMDTGEPIARAETARPAIAGNSVAVAGNASAASSATETTDDVGDDKAGARSEGGKNDSASSSVTLVADVGAESESASNSEASEKAREHAPLSTLPVDLGVASTAVPTNTEAPTDLNVGATVAANVVDVRTSTVDAGALVDVGTLSVDLGTTVGGSTRADVDAVGVGLGASTDLGTTTRIGATTSVDLGTATRIDTGTSVDLGTTTGLGVGTSVDLGTATRIDTGTSIDLGTTTGLGASTSVDLGTTTGLGSTSVDVGTSADLGTTSVDAGLDLGTTATVDTSPAVDTRVDLGVGDLNVSVDLGSSTPVDVSTGDSGATSGSSTGNTGVVGGLLGGVGGLVRGRP